jgi:hypothetical protein
MPSHTALAVVQATVNLARTHPQAPALDALDLVIKDRIDQILDFADAAAVNGSLAPPGVPFGQLLAAVFDEAMTPNKWAAFTGPTAEPSLRDVAWKSAHTRHAALRCAVWGGGERVVRGVRTRGPGGRSTLNCANGCWTMFRKSDGQPAAPDLGAVVRLRQSDDRMTAVGETGR